MKKIPLDKLLVERGFYVDEAAALRGVLAGEVLVGTERATSAKLLVAPNADLRVKGRAAYVSRGGFKLEAALKAFDQSVTGMRCLDAGCSTGGFTDCLLQAGAAQVAAVDVGYSVLDWKLRSNPRVEVHERTNIRLATPQQLGAPFDLIVADLSFIGLASLAPTFANLSHPGTVFIGLVKPQFEAAAEETDSRGFVASEDVRARTVEEVAAALQQAGFDVTGTIESPIHGAKSGNVEYLIRAVANL